MTNHHQIALALLLAGSAAGAAIDGWPQFRGPESLGVVENANLPDTWSSTENVAWKTEIPGTGWSSPVVWGDRIFLTSVISSDKQETPKKGLYFGGNRLEPPPGEHRWMVYCLDWKTEDSVGARSPSRITQERGTSKTVMPPKRRSPMASGSTPTSATSGCSVST